MTLTSRLAALLIFASLGAVGCGQNPIAPSSAHATTRLTMLVMGNTTQRPLVGVPASLVGRIDSQKLTDADGRASWDVETDGAYGVIVCGIGGQSSIVTGPQAGWLTSVPEAQCGR